MRLEKYLNTSLGSRCSFCLLWRRLLRGRGLFGWHFLWAGFLAFGRLCGSLGWTFSDTSRLSLAQHLFLVNDGGSLTMLG